MRHKFAVVFGGLALLAIVVTGASLVPSNEWWIQVLNFPRVACLALIAVVMLGCAIALRRGRIAVLIALAVAAGLQLWRIYPYVVFARREVAEWSGADDAPSCFTVFALNVLQENREYGRTLRMIEHQGPDVLLLMETDPQWAEALAPALARYDYRLVRPLDNTYGIIFASTLPVISARTENITDQDTPTVYARLETRDGQPFDFIGLHPRPPVPGQDTDRRDRKIAHAAEQIDGHDIPAIAMGDFNDVAWSPTTQHFKRAGGFLDPRIGRGSYPTFPSRISALGWPLDQMFVSPAFTFRMLRVLEEVGSDHRPLAATLCLAPARGSTSPARRPDR